MATNTEYLKTLITTAGGDASSLPDNLESTHYKALIEALANGTGGSGTSGGNTTGTPVWEALAKGNLLKGTEANTHTYRS